MNNKLHPRVSKFTSAPDLHSDDYAGSIGTQRDPITQDATAGYTYDCNPYGHTIYPYTIPFQTDTWISAEWRLNPNQYTSPYTLYTGAKLQEVLPNLYHGEENQKKYIYGYEYPDDYWHFGATVSVDPDTWLATITIGVYDDHANSFTAIQTKAESYVEYSLRCIIPNPDIWVHVICQFRHPYVWTPPQVETQQHFLDRIKGAQSHIQDLGPGDRLPGVSDNANELAQLIKNAKRSKMNILQEYMRRQTILLRHQPH